METKWLEDFVSLAETRSFSRSAGLRHVTQPAFSRRIQALEAWLGAELIDRSGYPTRLTQAGNIFHAQALAMLHQAREARTLLRGQSGSEAAALAFAVPHTLSLTFFPQWLQGVDARLQALTTHATSRGRTRQQMDRGAQEGAVAGRSEVHSSVRLHARLRALNVHDAVLTLTEGGCDLMMGYHHPSYPVVLDPRRYAFLTLGKETVSPFCAPMAPGSTQPRFSLPGKAERPVPYLAYSPDAYIGRMTEVLLTRYAQPLYLDKVYETDMAEGLKSMALAGHGIAFLPHSAAADALAAGRLVSAAPPGALDDALTMEIRLYRDRLAAEGDTVRKALVDAVWDVALPDMAAEEPTMTAETDLN